jgi:hypothetical protein
MRGNARNTPLDPILHRSWLSYSRIIPPLASKNNIRYTIYLSTLKEIHGRMELEVERRKANCITVLLAAHLHH